MVKIGHASLDENKKTKNGSAGDQTGKEVVIRDWYNKNWTAVFRAKDLKVAEKIAKTMEQACLNNNIGYDQNQRTTLYEHVKNLNWDITKVKEKCECDCSSLVAVCVNAAGIKVSKDMYTGNQKAVLAATGKFNVLTEIKYLAKPGHLKRGDILLASGHTAVVLTNAELKLEVAKSFDKTLVGTYKTTSNLNIRSGAGTDKEILTTISKGTEVICYGYFTRLSGTNWLYVQFNQNGNMHTGFASSKYLTRQI